jgi:hypothetical protein
VTHLLTDIPALQARISRVLTRQCRQTGACLDNPDAGSKSSAVLFLLAGDGAEPCLILNKRSRRVKQPGDLCCPGGSISPRLDGLLARLLGLPLLPLGNWPAWRGWRRSAPADARRLALLLATSLRESFEEMRLNPLGVRFLGPLPAQRLVLFHRTIFPMAGWVAGDQRFVPNWEVEKIVSIPLRCLLDPAHYVRYRLHISAAVATRFKGRTEDFPCFVFEAGDGRELLWGATFRMVMVFLELVFGFQPPDPARLPVVAGRIRRDYLTGC